MKEELQTSYRDDLADAQRRASLHAAELLACSVTIAGLDGTERSELDVALTAVREKAEEVGLLQRRPPRSVR